MKGSLLEGGKRASLGLASLGRALFSLRERPLRFERTNVCDGFGLSINEGSPSSPLGRQKKNSFFNFFWTVSKAQQHSPKTIEKKHVKHL